MSRALRQGPSQSPHFAGNQRALWERSGTQSPAGIQGAQTHLQGGEALQEARLQGVTVGPLRGATPGAEAWREGRTSRVSAGQRWVQDPSWEPVLEGDPGSE